MPSEQNLNYAEVMMGKCLSVLQMVVASPDCITESDLMHKVLGPINNAALPPDFMSEWALIIRTLKESGFIEQCQHDLDSNHRGWMMKGGRR